MTFNFVQISLLLVPSGDTQVMFRKLFIILILPVMLKAQECASRDYDNGGTVCVCNSSYCDTFPPVQRVDRPQILVYTSSKAGLRLRQTNASFGRPIFTINKILINPLLEYQTIEGWGGAFTDATGLNINLMNTELQENLLNSYFGENGLEYNLCRVPMGGTDFSTRAYSYDDGFRDVELNNFQLAPEDFYYKIPIIQRAQNLTNNNLLLMASTWTSPTWMKTNNRYNGRGFIREDMYQTWANYFVKFLDAYKEQGIDFWGLTTGNEPADAFIPGDALEVVGWTPQSVSQWVAENLGPTLRNSSYADIKIMVLDDQRMYLPWYVDMVFRNVRAKDYIDGIAVHWYLDAIFPPTILSNTRDKYPNKFILATEGCNMPSVGTDAVVLGSWDRGVAYSSDIIEDLENWVIGWIDWNMVLDMRGGPNYIGNTVDAPIIVNPLSGEFYKQPMYYHLGHFSKFIPRGSVRVGLTNLCTVNIRVVAFRRPDNGTAIVILNNGPQNFSLGITDGFFRTTQIEITEHSISTILYW